MSETKKYDFIDFGATGFTGKLVVEYLVERYLGNPEIKWALAGRNLEKLKSAGVEEYLLNHNVLTTVQLLKLKENAIITRDQLADLSSDELIDILTDLERNKADQIILESREHWFKD